MKKRILVTGAAGFIGFHFAKACLEQGHYVCAIDNFNNYYDPSLKRNRANELEKMGLEVQSVDVSNMEAIVQLMQDQQVTHVVHLAAQAGVRYSLDHPEVYVKSNIQGFLSILEGCKKLPGVRLVYASSSSVYGHNEKVPFSTDDPTDRPANFYAVTKKSNELMAYTYHQLYGFPTVGLRFFTVYGPWGRPDMAVFSFTKAAFEGVSINVYNNGESLRDFTYIDDAVDGVMRSLEHTEGCSLFNIGNSSPESVNTLMMLIEKETGRSFNRKFLPMQQGEIVDTYADISHTQQALGFSPRTSLAEGIHRFVSWYREYYRLSN